MREIGDVPDHPDRSNDRRRRCGSYPFEDARQQVAAPAEFLAEWIAGQPPRAAVSVMAATFGANTAAWKNGQV